MTARIRKPGVAKSAFVGTTMLALGAIALSTLGSTLPIAARTAAAAETTKAAQTTKAPLFIDADTVSVAKSNDCNLQNIFAQGSKVLFRIKVFSPTTGAAMGKTALQSVVVGLPKGQTLFATYADHKTDYFWTALWAIPANYPTGIVNYTITAHATNGESGHYVPFNVAPSSLTVVKAG